MKKFQVTSGLLNGMPQSKMLMKVTVPTGIKKPDFGTLVFNLTGQHTRLLSNIFKPHS